ncbi:MAG: hypothetical protein ACOY0R_13145 [Chloroflexota bacterium]
MFKPKLNSDEILKAEYDYIAATVFQANEDRARGASFYYVSVGSIVAAILGAQLTEDNLHSVALPFFILFLVMTVLGALTLAQLARLRAAWHESVEAMNMVKEYYLKQNPEIESAFKWRTHTIPETNKPNSIADLTAKQVTLLGALMAGAAVYFLLLWLEWVNLPGFIAMAAAALLGRMGLWAYYKHLLVDDR